MGSPYCLHSISTHWGSLGRRRDADIAAQINGEFIKTVTIDESVPYLNDLPRGVKIIVRNHPMSELFGNRGFRSLSGAENSVLVGDMEPEAATTAIEEYFAAFEVEEKDALAETRAVALGTTQSAADLGREHAEICNRMAIYCEGKGIIRENLWFEGLNEPMLWSIESPERVAEYYAAFLKGLHSYNLRGVVGNFGVGWPGNGGVLEASVKWDFFKIVFDLMINNPKRPDYLGLHEYWNLNGPGENWTWWAGRFLQCPANVHILITECGIDSGVSGVGGQGFNQLPGDERARIMRYIDELVWYWNRCRKDRRIRGIFVFTYDRGCATWVGFDTRTELYVDILLMRIGEFLAPEPFEAGPVAPPVTPPPPVKPPVTPPPVVQKIVGSVASSLPNDGTTYVYGQAPEGSKVMFCWRDDSKAIAEIQTGPHDGYPGWKPGYFNIPLYVNGGSPCAGKWDLWCSNGNLVSERVHFDTDGRGGVSNQIEVNFTMQTVTPAATLADALKAEFGSLFSDLQAGLPRHATLKYATRKTGQITTLVLHHAATPQTTTWKTVAEYHVGNKGWPGIGYHIGIRKAAAGYTVSLLNTPETVSYNSGTLLKPGDENAYTLAICVMGNYETDEVPDDLWRTVNRVTATVNKFLGRSLPLVGHKDIAGDTACPGRNLYARLRAQAKRPMPHDEPANMSVAELSEKLTWWIEKYTRCIEAGNSEYDPEYGKAILYSLIKRPTGLLYRMRNALAGGQNRG